MQKVLTKSFKETQHLAQKTAKRFKNGGIIALSGNLGSGKTTFAQGFAQGLKIKEKITSPSFLIIKQYQIPGKKNFFYHIDLYRLKNINLKTSGIYEILNDLNNVILIEWADRILNYLPKSAVKINLRRISQGLHEVELIN